MAKLAKTGVTYSSLYEKDCTLAEVIKNLGLKSLSRKAERQIRDRLGFFARHLGSASSTIRN